VSLWQESERRSAACRYAQCRGAVLMQWPSQKDFKQISNSKEAESHLFVCQIGPEAWGQFYNKITAVIYKFL
jgi:hypothetical protein